MQTSPYLYTVGIRNPNIQKTGNIRKPNIFEKWKNTIIGGFYRQWTSETCTKNEAEEQGIAILIAQIEKASSENKTILMLGDANLCSNKWRDLKVCLVTI